MMALQTSAGQQRKKQLTSIYVNCSQIFHQWFKWDTNSNYMNTDRTNCRTATISDCIFSSLRDSTFVTTLSSSWLFFVTIQKVGERFYDKLLKPHRKPNQPNLKKLCGSYFQSTAHSLIFIPAYLLILNPNNKHYQYLYKLASIYSFSYFLNLSIWEFIIPQTWQYRLVMLFHHIISGMVQFPVSYYGGITPLISALALQCELSNIFLNISWFAEQFGSKKWYKLSGYGQLITYPITRCIILPISTYKLLNLKEGVVPERYRRFALFGQVFVITISSVYYISILSNPNQILTLKLDKEDDNYDSTKELIKERLESDVLRVNVVNQ